MSEGLNWETLDALIEENAKARELIREMHEAQQSLAATVKDARHLLEMELAESVHDALTEAIKVQLTAQVDALGRASKREMDRCVKKVSREFSRLERIMLGVEGHDEPLEALIRKADLPAAFRRPAN